MKALVGDLKSEIYLKCFQSEEEEFQLKIFHSKSSVTTKCQVEEWIKIFFANTRNSFVNKNSMHFWLSKRESKHERIKISHTDRRYKKNIFSIWNELFHTKYRQSCNNEDRKQNPPYSGYWIHHQRDHSEGWNEMWWLSVGLLLG